MLKLEAGTMVRLRNGKVAGPLRDRKHENDEWPWGESCPHCGKDYPFERMWRPNGQAHSYFDENGVPFDPTLESPFDIVEVLNTPLYKVHMTQGQGSMCIGIYPTFNAALKMSEKGIDGEHGSFAIELPDGTFYKEEPK